MDARSVYVNAWLAETGTPDEFEPLDERAPSVNNHDELRGMITALADEAGGALGEVERALTALQDEVAQIRSDIAVERAARSGTVVDLPAFLERKRATA
jgi:hypothetical protein